MEPVRATQASVNCVIRCKNDYLFIKRSANKDVDAGLINVLGGKVLPEENYVQAAIREAREEVGDTNGTYITEKVEYKGTFIFRGGYKKDWIAQFYLFDVDSKELPDPQAHDEGELLWVNKSDFAKLKNTIWDLKYCWEIFLDNNLTFQAIAQLNDKEQPLTLVMTIINEHGFLVETKYYKGDKKGSLILQAA